MKLMQNSRARHMLPRIAIDFTGLDHLNKGCGQYRYAINLILGLVDLKPDANFLLIGSRAEPVAELKQIFTKLKSRWRYIFFPQKTYRGHYYVRHLQWSLLLLRERVNLLHALHGFHTLAPACPVVITQYDLMEEVFSEYLSWRKSRLYRMNKWATRKLARKVICISNTTANDLERLWGIDRKRISVAPLGVSIPDKSARKMPHALHDYQLDFNTTIILVSPYNLEPRKNMLQLLRAASILIRKYPKMKLILFGRGAITPEREFECDREINRLGLSETTIRTGFLSDEALFWLYEHSSVFIFPSLYEGFGLPILEAMGVGACVVARNASAMAEVLGDTGLLVETKNPNEMATAVEYLIRNPHVSAELKSKARERAAIYSISSMAQLTWHTYQSAISQET